MDESANNPSSSSTLPSSRPPIGLQSVGTSDLLSRVSSFLPQISAANKALDSAGRTVDATLEPANADENSCCSDRSAESGLSSSELAEGGHRIGGNVKKSDAETSQNQTIVLNFQLGSADDPAIAALAEEGNNDAADNDTSSTESESKRIIKNAIAHQVSSRPSKKPKTCLIEEVPSE